MIVPRFLVELFDPAARAMRTAHPRVPPPLPRTARRPRRPREALFRGGAVFGPGVPGGARQATPEELAEGRRLGEERAHHRLELHRTADAQFGEPIRAAAQGLAIHGRCRLELPTGTVTGRLEGFWRGDRVLFLERVSADGRSSGSSATRVPRRDPTDTTEALRGYLTHAVADLIED